jgi:hypothetical protein
VNVDVAVPPKYAVYAENRVEEAFPLTLRFPPKKEFPTTSRIFVLPATVDVLFAPRTKIFEVSVGYIIILFVDVDQAVDPPPPPLVISLCQLGSPPTSFNTKPFVETGSFVRTPDALAYKISPDE